MINSYTPEDVQEALRPLASLISKSEKAQHKLAAGTWQHTMLGNNLSALRIASALMSNHADNSPPITPDDLEQALAALASMIGKTQKAEAQFSPGTAQHTLQRNRLKALRIAQARITIELENR